MTAPLEALARAGFSEEEIRGYVDRQQATLRAGGFSEDEIQRWMGGAVSSTRDLRAYFRKKIAEARAQQPEGDFGFDDAFMAGFETSVSGLLGKHRELERTGKREPFAVVPKGLGLARRTVRALGQITGDLPYMTAGAFLAAPEGMGVGSAATAMGGAIALPEALRAMLMHKYEHGQATNFQEFWSEASAAFLAEAKGFLTGAALGTVGKIAEPFGGLAKYGAEVTTMATVGPVFEGRVPRAQDIADAAVLVAGLRASNHVAGKMRQLYAQMGRNPQDLLRDASRDPSIIDDLVSKNVRVPRAYQEAEPALRELERARLEDELRRQVEFVHKVAPEALIGYEETPVGRVLARISQDSGEASRVSTWDRLRTEWVDRLHPLDKAVRAMADGADVSTVHDAYRLARMLPANAARAEHFLRIAPYDFETGKVIAGVKPLREILSPLKDQLDPLRAYLVSRRAIELSDRGIETGVDLADARATVAELGPRYERVTEQLDAYQEASLRFFADSGMLSPDQFDAMRAANAAYVPFYRVLEDRAGGPGAGRGLQPRQIVRGIRGSERKIVDPLESIVKNTYTLVEVAERNRMAREFVEMAEGSGEVGSEFARRVTKRSTRKIQVNPREQRAIVRKAVEGRDLTESEAAALEESFAIFRKGGLTPGSNQIAVWRDGQREVWEVTPELFQVFDSFGSIQRDLLHAVLQAPARMMRAGAVLNPEFIGRNPIRDQLSAFLFSEHGFRPYLDAARGIFHLAKKDSVYAEFERSGGPMATLVSLDRAYLQNNLRELLEEGGLRGAARNVLRDPVEMLRIASESAEYATRIGVFERARKAGADLFEAGFESREATLDFNQAGTQARVLNAYIPFFNAAIRGQVKTIQAFRENPLRMTARVISGVTLPSVVLHLVNRSTDWYREVDQWQKDLFWLVSPNNGETIYRIPKPFEVGILFGTGAEKTIDWILDRDPSAFDSTLETLYRGAFPSIVPSAAAPVVEAWANRSLFLDRPLLSARMEEILPEYQYHPYTTELAKAVGHLLAEIPGMKDSPVASPILIENTIRSWTAGLGMHVLRAADAALRKGGVLPDPARPEDTLADIPFIKGFIVRYPTSGARSIQEFYERYRIEAKTLATIRELARRGEPDAVRREVQIQHGVLVNPKHVQETLSGLAALVRNVYRAPNMSPEEKRSMIDRLYFRMIAVAQFGNQMLDRYDSVREERREESP